MSVKVILWGLGAMGAGIGRTLLRRGGAEIVGAIRADPRKAGGDLGETLGVATRTGVTVTVDPTDVVGKVEADIVIHSTGSFVGEIYPQLEQCVRASLDVISIAEEMAYPWVGNPGLAGALDSLAREHGCTVLGTGINPGFVLDTLIIALTAACTRVDRIRASRINDLSPFGPTVMRTQGVGTTPEEFRAGVVRGEIVGHIGFPESISLIARALGWTVERVVETREPIIASVRRSTPHVTVAPGMVAGCRHVARGFVGGEERITLEHPQQVNPEFEGVETGDYIRIEGEPGISLSIKPEIPGGVGTIAVAVNMIPRVLEAPPGLVTVLDLVLPRFWPADEGMEVRS
ncbi:MAG: 2,4-diaminopentanoate dehydrogenase [Firmicutes bacterium]|jgi:4-hydroxy-tetrahydrodipicolinate reductase|nr:2,4-diaminopentanoate dehydrogenase [Bacillota bacterium]